MQKIFPFSYDDRSTPTGYCCNECGTSGVKLWRAYQTFLDHQTLRCYRCAIADQKVIEEQTADSDSIGWLVPAVPTEEGDTFWGYSAVPEPGVKWWYLLPSDWPFNNRRNFEENP